MFAIGKAFLGGNEFRDFQKLYTEFFLLISEHISSLEQEKEDPDVMSYLIYIITVTYIHTLIQNACSVRNSKS